METINNEKIVDQFELLKKQIQYVDGPKWKFTPHASALMVAITLAIMLAITVVITLV